MTSETYEALNKAWKSTCRILFGNEVGDLEDYGPWLNEYVDTSRYMKSESGAGVLVAINEYEPSARFASRSSIDFEKKIEPLGINEVKDIETIVQAIQDRLVYTGDVILGNSKFIEESTNITDSFYVYKSSIVSKSKNTGFSDTVRVSDNTFGAHGAAYCSYVVKGSTVTQNKRCFECHYTQYDTDCYYCTKAVNCSECLFCFGSQNAHHTIGNLELDKSKYFSLKAGLLEQMHDVIQKEKSIFSLLSILELTEKHGRKTKLSSVKYTEEKFDKNVIEEAFSRTSRVLLGHELTSIDDYARFLQKHWKQDIFTKSPVSSKKVGVVGFSSRVFKQHDIICRLLTEEEIKELGKTSVTIEEAGNLRVDAEALAEILGEIAYTSFDIKEGNNVNNSECVELINAENCYNGSAFVHSKKCAYCFWPRESEYIFGSNTVWESSFCINSYYSKRLTRAFECDSCESCADSYFCHNSENMQDAMFCFNAKNKRNAIGNAEMQKEKYAEVKKSLLEQIASELEKNKNLKWDVYTLGGFRQG